MSKTASDAHDKVNHLVKDVAKLTTNVQHVKESYLSGLREIKESAAAVQHLVGKHSRMRRSNGSEVFWYFGSISKYIDIGKQSLARIDSDVFVLRGYSAKLFLEEKDVEKQSWIWTLLRPLSESE